MSRTGSCKGPLVLIGFKGCGKSTIGRIIGDKTGLDFIDTDASIVRAYQSRTGLNLTFREVYQEVGGDQFRSMELDAVIEALKIKRQVVSFGGGTLQNAESAGVDFGDAIFVKIETDVEFLYNRVMNKGRPAFLDPEDPKGSFMARMKERTPLYDKYARFSVNNTNLTADHSADMIIAEVGQDLGVTVDGG